MKIDNRFILAVICGLTLLLFPVTAFSSGVLRIVMGFLCLLFFPGYALISALFPQKGTLTTLERVVLGIGMSIAVVPLIGLALGYSPWGIRLNPILISVGSFIFAASLAGIIRQQLMPADERFSVTLKRPDFSNMNTMSKILLALVIVAFLALAGLVAYSVIKPSLSPRPSEFYILNSEGKAENYPREVKSGSPVSITVTVINYEKTPTSYRIKITCDNYTLAAISTGELAPEEKWQQLAAFSLTSEGKDRKVDFQLYKEGAKEPYFKEPLYIYLDATP